MGVPWRGLKLTPHPGAAVPPAESEGPGAHCARTPAAEPRQGVRVEARRTQLPPRHVRVLLLSSF